MSLSTHPLLSLVDKHATGLKSLLTHYIDATVDSQFASLRNSIETMIQSGVIGPNCDGTHFGMTLPPQTHTNTDQSSDECSLEYSNDQLTRAQEYKNSLQNDISLANKINTESVIKQEFDNEEDGEEIDDDNVAKCENCQKGICAFGDDAEMGENRDECTGATELNVQAPLENNQTNLSMNDILPSPTNPINTQLQIKQECLQDSSITSIPLDFLNNADSNVISTDEQTNGQNTQIQTDEFEDNNQVDYDFNEGSEGEYFNQPNCEDCANGVCDLDHENKDVSAGDGDETDIETNLDEAQFDIDISVTNNTQMNNQNDANNVINERSVSERNNEQSIASTSDIRSSTRKRIQTKVFGDLVQSNVKPNNSGKRKSSPAMKSAKNVKRKHVLDYGGEDADSGDNDNQEEHANNTIGEELATECTTNPIQPNLAQPYRHFQCSHCHKSFNLRGNLNRHLRVHTGDRPFQCDLCGKRFSEKCNLTKHKMIHQDIKCVRCDQCDKRFKNKNNLASHMLVHQNIKRFRCHECERQFTHKCNLDSHLLIHSGDRPYECRHCEMSFTKLDTRNTHEQAIHLHVKPYRCKQCGHTATQRSHIIKHIRMVHFGLPHTIKQQRELNIIDHRDPRELIEKV